MTRRDPVISPSVFGRENATEITTMMVVALSENKMAYLLSIGRGRLK
jgi:hypothetical protein